MSPSRNQLNLTVTPWGLWVTKLALRSQSSVLCIACIIISLIFSFLSGLLIVVVPAACVTLCWNALSFVFLLRRSRADTHPGLRVATDLVTWLGWGVVAVDMSSSVSFVESITVPRYLNAVPAVKSMLVFAVFQALIHVALFIIACCETHVRIRTKKMMHRLDSKQQDAAA